VQKTQLRNFLLSLPERRLRSATALAGGLLREVGDVAIPKTIRRSQLYRNLVQATLRFLIEHVGQVKDAYPGEEKLSEDFLIRRTAGNGIELIGILTFRASPVWVLAEAFGTERFSDEKRQFCNLQFSDTQNLPKIRFHCVRYSSF